MADLGVGVEVIVDPPSGPTFAVAPPESPSVLVVPVAGPQGEQGSSVGAYTHTQTSPSAVWTVQHGLGFNPQPVVLDSDGQVVLGWTPTWPSNTVLILTFPTALTGTAYVS